MKEKHKVQYSVRDVPEEMNMRLREVAAEEEVSLNQAVLRAIERGLGMSGGCVRYRSLRGIVSRAPKPDKAGWSRVIKELDKVHPEDWS